jgi:hypothetical protein
VLEGDLVLKGGGDPKLVFEDLAGVPRLACGRPGCGRSAAI